MGGIPVVGNLFKTPKVPDIVAAPVYSAPEPEVMEAQEAADATKEVKKKKAGQSRTVFTTPLGLEEAPTTKKKTLLGQ